MSVGAVHYASPYDRSGYAVAARRYLRSLAAVGMPVVWSPLYNTLAGYVPVDRSDDVPTELLALPDPPAAPGADTTLLVHCIPHSWQQVRAAWPQGRCIGQTVWESDPIPRRWHRELAPADELWVPTGWNADVLAASGISAPVHVVPHAVETTPAGVSPVDRDPTRRTFLTVCTWDWRKRPDLTIHAFLQAFTADDDVRLVVKTDPQVLSWRCASPVELHTWWQVMSIVRQYPNPAEVVLVTEPCDDAQMAALIGSVDCYVSTTCAEGWGLGAFDAAVAGVPVLITGHGGHLEWLGADHPGAIPFRLVDADHPDSTMFEPGMQWALADVDATVDLLRSAVTGDDALQRATAHLAATLPVTHSSAAVGRRMMELLT